jgi:hypothetical protein
MVRTFQPLPDGLAAITSPALSRSGRLPSGASVPSEKPIRADETLRLVTTPTFQSR